MVAITGTVGSSGRYLVSGASISATVPHTLLKIVFENKTAGTNVGLFAGTLAQSAEATGGTQLSDSGGPGFQFVTLVDTASLAGQVLFVRRLVGTAAAAFVLQME
jgi:hypothetical protein